MLKTISIVFLAWLLTLGAAVGARAQVATPTGTDLLAALGLPVLRLTTTADGLTLSQDRIPAGRYLVTLDDRIWNGELVELVRSRPEPPPIGADKCSDLLPPQCFNWYPSAYLPGGVWSGAPQAILDLKGGVYEFWGPECCEDPAAQLVVTGDPDAPVTGPALTGPTITVAPGAGDRDTEIRVDGELTAGTRFVRFVNATGKPMVGVMQQYPGPITLAQVEAAGKGDLCCGATPPPDALDWKLFRRVAVFGPLSTGAAQWMLVALEPGQTQISIALPSRDFMDTNDAWSNAAAVVVPVADS